MTTAKASRVVLCEPVPGTMVALLSPATMAVVLGMAVIVLVSPVAVLALVTASEIIIGILTANSTNRHYLHFHCHGQMAHSQTHPIPDSSV